MKKRTSIRDSIMRMITGVLVVACVAVGVAGWSGIGCDESANLALQRYFATHPENNLESWKSSTEGYEALHNYAIQESSKLAAQYGTTIIAPSLEETIIENCTRKIKNYQGYITSLQKQYKDAIKRGDVAYAQQCQNLINIWNVKIAEETNYLNTYKASIGRK